MSRRHCGWWIVGVLLPLVLGGLVLMHTVEVAPTAREADQEHTAAFRTDAPIELHGEDQHGCDDCNHVGLHVTTVCVALLGSIAVSRAVRRLARGTMHAVAPAPATADGPEPPPLLVRLRPPWVELGVMLC